MTTTVLSQVGNQYVVSKEEEFGELPSPFTKLDFGIIKTINIKEDETLVEIAGINSGHTLDRIEDGVYRCTVSISTQVTKNSLPTLLEALFGVVTLDHPTSGKYTIISDHINSDELSYYMKTTDTDGVVWNLAGMHFTQGVLNVAKGQVVTLDLTATVKMTTKTEESLTPLTDVSDLFMDLDSAVVFGENSGILNSFSLTLNWNVKDDDGRGIEEVPSGERRLIQRVIRHRLSCTGSFESYLDEDLNTGYVEERVPLEIVLTLNRGTANEHEFTITGAKTATRTNNLTADSDSKVFSADFTAIDAGVVGDLSDDS
jgi:hypothetical protein